MRKHQDPYRQRTLTEPVPGVDRLMRLVHEKTGLTVDEQQMRVTANVMCGIAAGFTWLMSTLLVLLVGVMLFRLFPDTKATGNIIMAVVFALALAFFIVLRRRMLADMLRRLEAPDRLLREAYEPRLNRLEHRLTDGLRELAAAFANAAPWLDPLVEERGTRLATSFEQRIAHVRDLLRTMEEDVRAYRAASGDRDFEWETLDDRIKRIEEHLGALEGLHVFMVLNTISMRVGDLVACLEAQAANLPPLPLRVESASASVPDAGTEDGSSDGDAVETQDGPERLKRTG